MSTVTTSVGGDGGRIAVVIDRPPGNVLTRVAIDDLRHAIARVRDRRDTRLVTIEGAGPDFSFGASVEEHTREYIAPTLTALHGLIRDLLDFAVPTMAVVRGRCLGGGFEVALACDVIFAEDGATLGLPEVSLGVFPPAGAALLPVRIGTSRATEAILTGAVRPAAWWRDAGLIACVDEPGALASRVDAWYASACARRSAVALGYAAMATRRTLRHAALPALNELEQLYLQGLMTTEDAVEGIAAFIEKRRPAWRHA